METGLQHLHNVLRWAVLLFAVVALISGLRGMNGSRKFGKGDKRNALLLLITCDLQLVLGLVLYYLKGYFNNFSGGVMGEVMKNPVSRFWTIEHLLGMLIAIIIVHVGYAGTKGLRPDVAKFRRLFWCTLFALIIIMISIPWPSRMPGIAQPLFPGMTV